MRQEKKEDKEIKEFTVLMHDFLMEQVPPKETLQEMYQLSDGFFEKMEKLVCGGRKMQKKKERRYMIAAAAATAAVVLLFAQTQLFTDASEALVWRFVDHTSFQFEWNTDVSRTPQYEMQYVPEGYRLVLEKYYGICGCLVYKDQKENRLCLYYMPIDVTLDVENKNRNFKVLKEKEGQTVYYMEALGEEESLLIWENEGKTVKFLLSGKLTEEEILSVQSEIKIISN